MISGIQKCHKMLLQNVLPAIALDKVRVIFDPTDPPDFWILN
jgi:hypothetical protein